MPVPLFCDFQKQTKDFYKSDQYDFGKQVHLKSTCGETKLQAKVNHSDTNNIKSKFIATVNPSWGTLEATEDLGKGLSVEVKAPKIWRNLDLNHKIEANYCMDTKFKWIPKDSYWNAELKNSFTPNKNGFRICKTTLGLSVGDSELNLNVGGEITVEDKGEAGVFTLQPNLSLVTYKLGFLYTPNKSTSYSLIYTPEGTSPTSGLEYDFSLLKKCSDNCTISSRAQGKVATILTSTPPTLSFGGKWQLSNGNSIQGFFDSKKQWGGVYKHKVNESLNCHFGFSSFFDQNTSSNVTNISYKFCFE